MLFGLLVTTFARLRVFLYGSFHDIGMRKLLVFTLLLCMASTVVSAQPEITSFMQDINSEVDAYDTADSEREKTQALDAINNKIKQQIRTLQQKYDGEAYTRAIAEYRTMLHQTLTPWLHNILSDIPELGTYYGGSFHAYLRLLCTLSSDYDPAVWEGQTFDRPEEYDPQWIMKRALQYAVDTCSRNAQKTPAACFADIVGSLARFGFALDCLGLEDRLDLYEEYLPLADPQYLELLSHLMDEKKNELDDLADELTWVRDRASVEQRIARAEQEFRDLALRLQTELDALLDEQMDLVKDDVERFSAFTSTLTRDPVDCTLTRTFASLKQLMLRAKQELSLPLRAMQQLDRRIASLDRAIADCEEPQQLAQDARSDRGAPYGRAAAMPSDDSQLPSGLLFGLGIIGILFVVAFVIIKSR